MLQSMNLEYWWRRLPPKRLTVFYTAYQLHSNLQMLNASLYLSATQHTKYLLSIIFSCLGLKCVNSLFQGDYVSCFHPLAIQQRWQPTGTVKTENNHNIAWAWITGNMLFKNMYWVKNWVIFIIRRWMIHLIYDFVWSEMYGKYVLF